jgi:SAM-dependent methyltransferase
VSTHRWSKDNQSNIHLYSELAQRYGIDFRAADWGSRDSQEKRFQVLCEIGDLDDRSVLDIGCGQGDLYGWLKRHKKHARYTGLDITPHMVDQARKRFPKARFCDWDLLDDSRPLKAHDYVVSSGIFAHRRTSPFEFLKAMVRRMFELSRRGVAFNSLSTWATEKVGTEFHADPLKVLAFCRALSPRVALRHDYHPRDFTVYVYKGDK